jgi:hypothetical protein
MTTTADAVIARIDYCRPGLKLGKKHLLLFFAQGHHLAHFGDPLFVEPIFAIARQQSGGVGILGACGAPTSQPKDEGSLNTIGLVIERYASLAPADLRAIIKASRPWRDAGARVDLLISRGDLRDWFRREDETNDPDDERPNRAERAQANALWKSFQEGTR